MHKATIFYQVEGGGDFREKRNAKIKFDNFQLLFKGENTTLKMTARHIF